MARSMLDEITSILVHGEGNLRISPGNPHTGLPETFSHFRTFHLDFVPFLKDLSFPYAQFSVKTH